MKYLFLIFLILTLSLSSCFLCPECEECPEIEPPEPPQIEGFEHSKTFNGNFYYLAVARGSWKDAKIKCEEAGGHLVTIHSDDENDIVLKVMGLEHGWIGLTDEGIEGNFSWITNESLTYTNWMIGEPSNTSGIEHFGLIHGSNHPTPGTWNDSPNEMNYYYVLEIPFE